ncbi:nucleoside-binding protein [Lachnotalea glycerini]|uniref:BMP family ABC transporter substrate-binding protein n=1 Tax=Lachnotalea glycerini TaxID=1763509 RepID=A0A255IBK2_9FIRM|nr:BMP family ABC transporter substrate-binding protein [Lachnotalea glycerini]PXV91756.1 nucleoside-binding protein [Lachnotalea glycerini]RDY29824.1 BMP family ABC transporter substrate-binding protein [Lachnotalea glycerini]
MRRLNFLFVLFCVCAGSLFVSGCVDAKDNKEDSKTAKSLANDSEESEEEYEIALVTDLGTIEDKSFNQASWEGIRQYAKEHKITYTYYQPEEGTNDAYLETIDNAIKNGAKLVVCPGFLFETPVFIAQEKYPNVNFILIDGEPQNAANTEYRIDNNVLAILFQEEQAGFLAGYAAVKDKNTKLGFLGGMAVPAVIRYGYGFVQGCDYAASEDNINVEIKYTYTGTFQASSCIEELASSWYQNGIEVIFSCGGAVGNSVIAAAEQNDAKVIGVDVDQSEVSDVVITSAMKMIQKAVYCAIEEYYTNTFPGGTAQTFSAINEGIGIPLENSKFQIFTQSDYENIYAKLVSGEIVINNSVEDSTTADIILSSTTVEYID